MAIKVWQSYSCNNSSSYRLVARFADAASAQAVATELDGFFKAYAKEMDAIVEANDYTWPDKWPPGAVEFASKYGVKLGRNPISWGDEGLTGDEPEIYATDETLLLFHSYSGGFGKEIPAYLTARGATKVEREDQGDPTLSVLFAYAGGNKKLDRDLAKLFGQIDIAEDFRDVEPLETPWKSRQSYGTAAFYRDARTVGMVFPFSPRDLTAIRGWLTKHGIEQPSLRFCEPDDELQLAACAGATCTACGAALELWHPRLRDDVETPQMVCVACGGMYEMATMIAAAKQRARARARAERKAAEQAAAAAAIAAAAAAKTSKAKPKAKAKSKARKK